MRYLGASVAVLVAAMTFSLTPLGQTARAFEDKFTAVSIIDRNTLLPSIASSNICVFFIDMYMNPPKLLEALTDVNLFTCQEAVSGE
jgi:hypothetical protein